MNTNSKFTIDMRNSLYDTWKDSKIEKTIFDMQNMILSMFELENTPDGKRTVYTYI